MGRFFVDPSKIKENEIIIDSKKDFKHIVDVLRMRVGDTMDVSDTSIWEYKTKIIQIENQEIILQIIDKQHFAREVGISVTLFQSLPKQKKMDEIIQKTIELGINEIVPVFTGRSLITEDVDMGKKVQRWNRIASETVKQCQRGIIPSVSSPLKFKDLLKTLAAFDLVLFPYENEDEVTIKQCLRHLELDPESIAIIIGPEGGFSDQEAEELVELGAKSVSLGRTILRTETAGPTALAMTLYELEMDG